MKSSLQSQRDINQAIRDLVVEKGSRPTKTTQAARYSMATGGQRYRGRTTLAVYEALGKSPGDFMKCAAGIECLHHATLILDDLPMMDNAPTRRGKPAVHLVYGPSISILAALYLENRGRQLIRECASEHNASSSMLHEIMLAVEHAAEKLINGQELDLKHSRSKKELESMLLGKNFLFSLACTLPGIFLKKKKILGLLSRTGAALSVGYQLVDDLRDLDPDESRIGKPVGADIEKKSSLYIYGEAQLRRRIEAIKKDIVNELEDLPSAANLAHTIDQMLTV